MPALIETARQQLEEAKAALAAAGPEGELPLLTQNAASGAAGAVELLQSQLELLRAEQAGYEALSELYPLERDLLIRARNTADKRMEAWQAVMAEGAASGECSSDPGGSRKTAECSPYAENFARQSQLTLRRKEIQEFLEMKTAGVQETSATLKSVEERSSCSGKGAGAWSDDSDWSAAAK
ncbi:MAG UNVERIFIED_CONTAM: hypothetical protein LVR18_48435 [Planctomycetaceae bacterium]|jgi:hypothetical protein